MEANEKTETKIHPFEKDGLGKAPFKCVGMWTVPSAAIQGANPEAWNREVQSMWDWTRGEHGPLLCTDK